MSVMLLAPLFQRTTLSLLPHVAGRLSFSLARMVRTSAWELSNCLPARREEGRSAPPALELTARAVEERKAEEEVGCGPLDEEELGAVFPRADCAPVVVVVVVGCKSLLTMNFFRGAVEGGWVLLEEEEGSRGGKWSGGSVGAPRSVEAEADDPSFCSSCPAAAAVAAVAAVAAASCCG